MEQASLLDTGAQDVTPVSCEQEHVAPHASELYVAIGPDASFKVGTCEHCVLFEQGRPGRAWDADGDAALDFDRETYFACLGQLGLVIGEREAYVCP